MANYFYYERDGEVYQIVADRFERVNVTDDGSEHGWYQNLVWDSGLTETVKDPNVDPNAVFNVTGERCGGNNQGLQVIVDGANRCAQDGRPPRQRLQSISFFYVGAVSCRTIFYRNNQAVLTLDTCPAINDGDPRNEACSACCRQLLPIVRNIRV